MGRVKKTKTEDRRLRITEQLAARPGISERALARAVGCSRSTAHSDVVAVRAEWAERRRALVESCAAEDLARTDAAIAAIWPMVQAGKLFAVDRLVSLLDYRARVLNVTKPKREMEIGDALAGILERLASQGSQPDAHS